MAEVTIELSAVDNVTPVVSVAFASIQDAVLQTSEYMTSEAAVVEAGWQGMLGVVSGAVGEMEAAVVSLDGSLGDLNEAVKDIGQKLSEGIEVNLSADEALAAVGELASAIEGLEQERSLVLDASEALAAAQEVRDALDAIPDVTYKTVIVQYQTQASPVMDFSEGIAYIKKRMESLPTEGTYTVKYSGVDGGYAQPSQGNGSTTQNTAFTANVTVNASGAQAASGGQDLAREIDRTLADLWRYNRSELRRAAGV